MTEPRVTPPKDHSQSLITMFTCPKASMGHVDVIQRNAVESWQAMGGDVEVILIGDEPGVAEIAEEFRCRHLPQVARNEFGTPLVSALFELARGSAGSPILCYANCDVLFLSDFLPAVRAVRSQLDRFLVAGRRWDLEVRERLRFGPGWEQAVRDRVSSEGRLHAPAGSDYFVFPRDLLQGMPPFALGRAGWDNWVIYAARRAAIPVVDGSTRITVVHQDHDYAHLPGGQPHYRLPESRLNQELAGGQEMIFRLEDADWVMTDEGARPRRLNEFRLPRWVETQAYLRLGPGVGSRLVRLLLHPWSTWIYYAGALARRLGIQIGPG